MAENKEITEAGDVSLSPEQAEIVRLTEELKQMDLVTANLAVYQEEVTSLTTELRNSKVNFRLMQTASVKADAMHQVAAEQFNAQILRASEAGSTQEDHVRLIEVLLQYSLRLTVDQVLNGKIKKSEPAVILKAALSEGGISLDLGALGKERTMTRDLVKLLVKEVPSLLDLNNPIVTSAEIEGV